MKKNLQKIKSARASRRHARVRYKLFGSAQKPRLSVYRSLKHIHAQLIDDLGSKTLVAASDLELDKKIKKADASVKVGELLAQKAIKAGIKEVIFDRGSFKYHGRIKALADAARQGGLKF